MLVKSQITTEELLVDYLFHLQMYQQSLFLTLLSEWMAKFQLNWAD